MTPLLPELRDELVAAANRMGTGELSHAPGRRSRRALLLAATFALGLTGTAGGVLVATGVVGGEPSVPFPRVSGEEDVGMSRTGAPVVLGVARMPTVGRVEIVGYRMRGYRGRGELLCVDLVLPDGSKGGGCDYGLPARARGLQATGTGTPKLAGGAASREVARVSVRFRRRGTTQAARARLVRVPAAVAARLRTRPFAYFLAEVPARTRSFVAVARDRRGAVAWTARFPP